MDTMPKQVNGLTAHYFWRKSVRDGQYKHPQLGFTLSVDAARRKIWSDNFAAMQRNGVAVPIVKDHKVTSDSMLGYVVGMRNNGQWLEELHQYLGDASRDVALKNRISVGIDPNFVDGERRKYGDAIVHSATTPVPVVPDTGAIAASRGQGDMPILLSLAAEGADMATVLTAEHVAAIKKAIGGGDDVTAENVLEKLLEWARAKEAAVSEAKAALSLATSDRDAVKVKLTTAEADLAAAKQQIQTLSLASPKAPDPAIIEELAEVDEAGLTTCVERGAITPAVKDKLLPILLGIKGTRNVLALSRAGESPRLSRQIIDALKDNKPVAMGSATGIQQMSRQVPGDDGNKEPTNPWDKVIKAAEKK